MNQEQGRDPGSEEPAARSDESKADPAGDSGPIPLAPEPAQEQSKYPVARPAGDRSVSTGRIPAPSVLSGGSETCPRCGATLSDDAVICVGCGYDLKANVVREPELGVVEVERTERRPAFVPDIAAPMTTLMVTGGVLTLLALVLGGVTSARVGPTGYVLARLLLVLYFVLLHTATGAVAVFAAAWLTGKRLGSLEQAVARMFVTVAGFVLVLQAPDFGLYTWLAGGLRWILAAGVYFGLLFLLFRRSRNETGVLAGAHALLWLFTSIGMQLAVWVSVARPPAP